MRALSAEAPPLARIDRVDREACTARSSARSGSWRATARGETGQWVSPDVAICPACEAELFDPADRRYRYPFITCTNCGPRYSVIERMPYDRERTSMRAFGQCPACAREYASIGDRRYHSETNSCPVCGPRLRLPRPPGRARWAAAIRSNRLRRRSAPAASSPCAGVGGFHLACDATDEAAVARLRRGKHRDGKPLAVMVRSLDDARRLALVSDAEAEWLARPARPIVVLEAARRIAGGAVGGRRALDTSASCCAYTPVHLLLLEAARRPLVMTSGNRSGEPLAASLDEALRDLGDVAGSLPHARSRDRGAHRRLGGAHRARRAPGGTAARARPPSSCAAPAGSPRSRWRCPLPTPVPLVAVGPHLKNTFTVATGRDAYVSPHVGDLETLDTAEHWRATYDSFRDLFRVEPTVVVRDLHPQYLSTRLAEELRPRRASIAVQHHHAHIAAVAGEHGVASP